MNYSPIILNTSGLTMEHANLKYRCELNAIDMMNQATKTSKEAYYILLVAFLILILYMFVPKLQEDIQTKRYTLLFIYDFININILLHIYNV